MVEHYSHKIQNVIQKELFKAQKSIKIAVAWFTNDLLFQPLLLKLQAGVIVELILNKDEINDSAENEVDFNAFVEVGGVLHWNTTKTLMHEKFCIIDDSVVIYGSYNWTNKAEYNDESIAVSKDEENTSEFYKNQFKKLCDIYPCEPKVTKSCSQEKEETIERVLDSRYHLISKLDEKKYEEERSKIIEKCRSKLTPAGKVRLFFDLLSLADRGDPISALYIGSCYKYGIFINSDSTLANKYFSISAKLANPEAMIELACNYTGSYSSPDPIKDCENYISDASDLGHTFAKWLLPRLE